MPFSYHRPTGRACSVCDALQDRDRSIPIIDVKDGKASSANNFPFHNWYNFVLGYSPQFPKYMLDRERMTPDDLVMDPFMGSGTTLVECKNSLIPSMGIDANDFIVDAARAKLMWDVDLKALMGLCDQLLHNIEQAFQRYHWDDHPSQYQLPLFAAATNGQRDYQEIVAQRPALLLQKYISDKPFARASIIAQEIEKTLGENALRPIFDLALISIIVPISNIRYGPGFGVGKPKDDVNVLAVYASKLKRMITDLRSVNEPQKHTVATVELGDTRQLSHYFGSGSVSLMVTSPPYPGDHEYTKHTKLELLFGGYAQHMREFQTIKKRMIRASTTNLYKDDYDRKPIESMESIRSVTDLIDERLRLDGATSGFEGLYTKLVWEYFGGMYQSLAECFKVLRPGGKIALLVSDSHAFKMVHIQTAAILGEIGLKLGYVRPEIILWQNKISTSHKYYLRENILILQKP